MGYWVTASDFKKVSQTYLFLTTFKVINYYFLKHSVRFFLKKTHTCTSQGLLCLTVLYVNLYVICLHQGFGREKDGNPVNLFFRSIVFSFESGRLLCSILVIKMTVRF